MISTPSLRHCIGSFSRISHSIFHPKLSPHVPSPPWSNLTMRRMASLPTSTTIESSPTTQPFAESVTIPEPPVIGEITDLTALGEPTLSSLGLCSYWPSGWYQSLLETLHVSLDIPWWGAIAISTLVFRMALFPFLMEQRKNLSKYSSDIPKITALQKELTKARLSGDQLEAYRVSKEMQAFMQTHDVNPLKNFKVIFLQNMVFLSIFAGLRGMALLPVESLKTGGLFWFLDLTSPDPYYLLPLLSMTSILLMFEVGADGAFTNLSKGMRTVLRIFPFFGFLMVMNMPSANLLHWTISNFFALAQTGVTRIPAVKKALNLPTITPPPPTESTKSGKGFIADFKESMANNRLIAELEARERLDAKAWQKAGKVKVPPTTYAYNPKQPPNIRLRTNKTVGDSSLGKKVVKS